MFGLSVPLLLVLTSADAIANFLFFINSGAEFFTSRVLNLLLAVTGKSVSTSFYNIIKSPFCILSLSDDGNDNHTLPSSAT